MKLIYMDDNARHVIKVKRVRIDVADPPAKHGTSVVATRIIFWPKHRGYSHEVPNDAFAEIEGVEYVVKP